MRAEGVQLSDRRAVKGLKLLAGAALLRLSTQAELEDFWPLEHLWTSPSEAEAMGNIIHSRMAEAGGRTDRRVRQVQDIQLEFETLVSNAPTMYSDASIGAHLMALNSLRRELAMSHPDATEVRQRVDQMIHSVMSKLEPEHV
jgi:MoxR-like ATPase